MGGFLTWRIRFNQNFEKMAINTATYFSMTKMVCCEQLTIEPKRKMEKKAIARKFHGAVAAVGSVIMAYLIFELLEDE